MQAISKLQSALVGDGTTTTTTWIMIAGLGLAAIIAYGSWPYGYWKRRGVKGPRMLPIIGNMMDLVKIGFREMLTEYPKRYGRVYGTYFMRKPVLVVGDPEMVKQICIKQADYFTNRNSLGSETKPFDRGITVLKDQEWKHVRNLMTPSFSSGKIKAMFSMVERCSLQLCRSLLKEPDQPLDVKNFFTNFTVDVVASTMFGLQVNSQENPDNEFNKHTKKIFSFSFTNWKIWALFLFPSIVAPLFKKFNITLFPQQSLDFFQSVINNAMRDRAASSDADKYHDFLAAMVTARQEAERQGAKGLTEDEVMAQSLTLFLAGFETTANAMQYIVYFLALNPDCQEKAFAEVTAAAKRHGGHVTYDCMKELQYLNQCIDETLRLCPPALLADRVCKETTVVNGFEIEKGVVIHLPIYSLANDPELWENPEQFNPDRFSPELAASRDSTYTIPFGLGPRNCIGMRLAQMELRKSLAEMLLHLKWIPDESTPTFDRLQFKTAGLLATKDPIMLKVLPRVNQN